MANEFGASPNLGMRRPFSPPNVTEYPKMLWGPNGERQLFTSAAEVPAGWGTLSPEDKVAATLEADKAEAATKAAAEVAAFQATGAIATAKATKLAAKLEAEKAAVVVPLPLTRQQIGAALTQGGVEYQPLAPMSELDALLVASLETHLTDVGVSYPEGSDSRALLAIVTALPPTKPAA